MFIGGAWTFGRLAPIAGVLWWLGAMAASATASAATCDTPPRPPAVVIEVERGTVAYDNIRSRSELTSLSVATGAPSHPSGLPTIGLTSGDLRVSYETEVAYRPLGRGSVCVWPTRVEVRIGYPQTTVYVARKYRPGSCVYAEVLEHEHQHVAINENTLREHLGDFRRRLGTVLREKPALEVDHQSRAVTAYTELVRRALSPAVDRMVEVRDRRHRAIDSPSGYLAIAKRCQDW